MKRLLYILVLFALILIVLASCSTNTSEPSEDNNTLNVEAIQMSLVNKMTATWCSSCGTWGWDLFKEIIAEVESDAVIMSTYAVNSSDLNNFTASEFYSNFSRGAGLPAFCVNGRNATEYGNGGVYTNATKNNIVDEVYRKSKQSPLAGAAYKTEIIDDVLAIETRVKFFKDTEGDYFLGLYIIEDGVINRQAYRSDNARHRYVLRGSGLATTWGEEIASGSISSGSTMDREFQVSILDEWDRDNISVALVIWKRVGNDYEFVNAYTR